MRATAKLKQMSVDVFAEVPDDKELLQLALFVATIEHSDWQMQPFMPEHVGRVADTLQDLHAISVLLQYVVAELPEPESDAHLCSTVLNTQPWSQQHTRVSTILP